MRWRRCGSPFQRNAVFNRRTWPLVHLTICSLRIRWSQRTSRKQFTPMFGALHQKHLDSISYGSGITGATRVVRDELVGRIVLDLYHFQVGSFDLPEIVVLLGGAADAGSP